MSKFTLGQVVVTRRINEKMKADSAFWAFVHASLHSYSCGEWGCLTDEDKLQNEEAVAYGEGRIMGAYLYPKTKEKIWIITEWDRSVTTVLFPDEY